DRGLPPAPRCRSRSTRRIPPEACPRGARQASAVATPAPRPATRADRSGLPAPPPRPLDPGEERRGVDPQHVRDVQELDDIKAPLPRLVLRDEALRPAELP